VRLAYRDGIDQVQEDVSILVGFSLALVRLAAVRKYFRARHALYRGVPFPFVPYRV
jgi:hypothetical protein